MDESQRFLLWKDFEFHHYGEMVRLPCHIDALLLINYLGVKNLDLTVKEST